MRFLLNERWLSALILAAIALLASFSGALSRFDNLLYDLGERVSIQAAPSDVVIVAIDQDSLGQLGRWPWSRGIHAALVERLSNEGARVIALDMVFAEPDTAGQIGDAQLASAIAKAGNVVLPVMIEQTRLNGEMREVGALPQLAESAAAIGRVHVEIERDGIARGLYLREGLGSAYWPHFTEAINNLLLGKPAARNSSARNSAAGNTSAREGSPYTLIREGYRRIPFLGPPGHFQTLSYVQVLTGNYPPGLLKNKIILVGATASGLGDRLSTPVSGLAEGMPGVEVHANALQAFRDDSFIRPLPTWATVLATVLLSLAPVSLLARLNPRAGLLASLLMLLAVALLAMWLPHVSSYYFPPASALLAILVAYPVWSWRRLEAASRYIDKELLNLKHDMTHSAIGDVAKATVPSLSDDLFESRIADIQAASSRLRDLRSLIDQVLEGMPHGVVALDHNKRIKLMNRRAQEWMGLTLDMPLPDSTDFQIKAGERGCQHEISSLQGTPLLMDQTVLMGHGLNARPGAAQSGIASVINLMDISEIKRLEAEKRETLAFLSHDLRAPLSMALDLVKQPDLSTDALNNVRIQLGRAHGLAEQFLLASRAETADVSGFVELDFCGLAHQAADALFALAREKNLVIQRHIQDEPIWVKGEFGLLERMAVNLIQNAVKYAPSGGIVKVELSRTTTGQALFCVQDNGAGIAPQDIVKLFRRFSRVEGNDQSKVTGAGLGLYFVRIVAEKHGGQATVTSSPGEGARFCVSLPALD